MIDKYTRIVNEVRPIVQKKQKAFDNAMVAIIVGIMMYVVAVLLRKGGFEVPNRDKQWMILKWKRSSATFKC